ncbi:hypothetical protein [Vibrio phage RYC]|nr:hypothetical protein [Vibrio phage RYC]
MDTSNFKTVVGNLNVILPTRQQLEKQAREIGLTDIEIEEMTDIELDKYLRLSQATDYCSKKEQQ